MLVLRRPETAQGLLGFLKSGNSAQTRTADQAVAEAVQKIRGERYFSAVFELIDLFSLAGAEAIGDVIDPRAFVRTRDLLDSLPHGFAVPEVGIDPDGEVALDWIQEDRTMVSVSIGPAGGLSYAANLRDGTAHGVIHWSEGFPAALTELLRRLYHPA